ncbi:MAG: LptF/LptG family permease [Fusobacteriaceae bacterium]|jgi:lipopolysaccharide export system permease protein|nr:LptF/LptG family permease [Fusobacteriaceae bacterium]
MKIIHKYIIEEIKMPIIFGISIFTFVFIIEIIVTMMESIIVKGISLIDIIRMLSFYLPPILSQTIPMGMFLGIMLTFSKFTRTSESTAMYASGLDLKTILKPIVCLSVVVTLFIFFLQESIIPRSFSKLQYLTTKIAYENPVFNLKDKTFIDEVDKYNLYIDRIDKKTNIAGGVLVFQNDEKAKYPTVLIGNEAYWKESSMIITNSIFYTYDETGKETLRGDFDNKKIPLTAYFDDIDIKIKDIEAMSINMMLDEMKKLNKKEKIPYKVEIQRKLALPLSTIMLGILGVLLSIGHHRSWKGTSYSLCLGIIFAYIVILNMGMVLASREKIPIFLGIWTPNVILLILTFYMYKYRNR